MRPLKHLGQVDYNPLGSNVQCYIILQQMLTQIIISILIAQALTITNLTSSNCPNNFNAYSYNQSLYNSQLATSVYSNVFSSNIQANITNFIAKGDLSSLTNIFMSSSFLLPYVLVAGVFALLFVVTICCCTFERRCPPCKSWRRNYLKQPYTRLETRLTTFFALIFSTGSLITTIVVFSSFKLLRSDINMTKCGIYYSLDITANGNQSTNWGGFAQVQSQISNITSLLNSTATTTTSQLSNNSWITDGYLTMENMNLNLYTNNINSTVYSPDPVGTTASMNQSLPLPTITPKFILQGLGPNGTANTMVTDIDSGLKVTEILTSQAQKTYQSSITFSNSVSNIITNANINLQKISIVTTQLNNSQTSIDKINQNYLTYAAGLGIYVIQALFGTILLATLITLLGLISTHIFQILTCKKMVQAGWVLFGVQYFGVILVLFIFLLVGGISYCFCQYFSTVINNQNSFLSYSLQANSASFNQLFQYLDVCFFSDGNILKKFSLESQMNTVSNLFLNVQTYLNMQTTGNAQYVDLTVSTGKIIGWMAAMNKYGLGLYSDALSSVNNDSNPEISLSHMNLRTLSYNSTGVNTLCSNDLWVYDAANCSFSASQALYTASATTANGVYFPPTGSLCIPLNTRISNSAPSIWTASDIAQRYYGQRQCKAGSSSAYDKIIQYARAITNYRDSRINLYQSLSDQLNSLLTVNNNYNTNMTSFTGSLNTFFSSVSAINNLVTNQINGLTISNNCTAIANSFRFFYNMYCVNFFNRSVKIAICCLVLLVLMIGSVLVGSVFGVRYERIQREKKMVAIQLQPQILKEQTSELSDESAGSHSSEQNN